MSRVGEELFGSTGWGGISHQERSTEKAKTSGW